MLQHCCSICSASCHVYTSTVCVFCTNQVLNYIYEIGCHATTTLRTKTKKSRISRYESKYAYYPHGSRDPICTSIQDIKGATEEDAELQIFKRFLMRGWPNNRKALELEAEKYWPIRHELPMVNGTTMKAGILSYLFYCRDRFLSNHTAIT